MTRVLGIDVGGTFTDAVLLADGDVRTAKVPTARRQEESVAAAARAVGADRVDRFTHGTTVATNALLERKGARTALVATAGFEHVLQLRRQARAHLYRLCARHPEPLVPLERSYGVRGRMGPDGVVEELDLDSLEAFDAEAVAVCLLHAYRHPEHERAVAAEVRRRLPGAHVVASHEVAPEFREYERASTTAADAYLGPVTSRYLRGLAAVAAEAGLPEPLVMRSSGGVASLEMTRDTVPDGDIVPVGFVHARAEVELEDPDADGIGRLIRISVTEGRQARPELKIGICGEHGGDPESVHFFHQAGLDYVSCSPFRVPIARLAAAQAAFAGRSNSNRD